MNNNVVYFPRESSVHACTDFWERLFSFSGKVEVVISFETMGRVEPFLLLFVGWIIRDFKNASPSTKVNYYAYGSASYAGNMGFFHSIGLSSGKQVGELKGSHTYIPISYLNFEDVDERAGYDDGQDIIEKDSYRLAEVLARSDNSNLYKTLAYSLTEILRNVYEHAGAAGVWYSGQYWPYYGKVEIAVLDEGKGIRLALNDNPYVKAKTDKEAIERAMLPGVSGKFFKGKKVHQDEKWRNSGFGLYMTSRLCRNGGEFYLCSGDHLCGLNVEEAKRSYVLPLRFSGTAIKMVINTEQLFDLNVMQEAFRIEGYKIAKELENIGDLSAPAASQYITRDFRKLK